MISNKTSRKRFVTGETRSRKWTTINRVVRVCTFVSFRYSNEENIPTLKFDRAYVIQKQTPSLKKGSFEDYEHYS